MAIKKAEYKDYEVEFALRDIDDYEKSLHALMDVVGATVDSLESTAGMGAGAMCYMAGKRLGKRIGAMIGRKSGLESAIDALSGYIEGGWKIELWKPVKENDFVTEEGNQIRAKLVFRDCIVRQTLERQGIPQKRTMCYLTNGYVCGAIEVMLGMRNKIDLHAGNNACLKELTLTREEGGV
ncbi:MAG TPA: hydrocarbon binding protein (contains V4R domain) [Candidatus Altiarchaeales archaeon]|nr:hydrocarbon binding protein (contains V4R domain) [Candidatus Altiarchaeales archaeon]